MWNRPKKDITQLPPTHDSAILHICRANYQTFMWKSCLEQCPHIQSPDDEGWEINNRSIIDKWMTQPRAPESVLIFAKCGCRSQLPCSSKKRGCSKRQVACTYLTVWLWG